MAKLNSRTKYLQIALNGNLDDAERIIRQLPASERIIIEAGTPLIKQFGIDAAARLNYWWQKKLIAAGIDAPAYIVADMKTIDRGATEARMAAGTGASAAIAAGLAPIETLNSFIGECEILGIDAMIDMMNVEYSLNILRQLKKQPAVVVLHRGVDELTFNKEKQIPYHEIQRIKGNYNIMLAIAGADTPRETQRSFFNGADIAVVWKNFYAADSNTVAIAQEFLRQIK
ncbi:MAG: orotidine 5'-phosphate decarboxylase [Candidatus Nealsonbacteria bacterium DGGOD1a]|jgi:bifunctional enzyme Fae/Hps|nr:MAG: orotidine 5'-phosphate decarboxylase [Candidatus Nealsonbacteria bacterium DGGOD1a]